MGRAIALPPLERKFNMTNQMNVKVNDWYRNTYPTDNAWLDENFIFQDLFSILLNGKDIYQYIDDSVVRERCFTKLAEIIGQNYDYIYRLWQWGLKNNM